MPPSVVLDTNVVLDWLLFGDPHTEGLAEGICAGRLQWISTAAMREELAEVLQRPAVVGRFANSERALQAFDRWTTVHPSAAAPPAHLRCRDADDQIFIDLALACRADWLLTRDKALLELGHRAGLLGTRICTPRSFMLFAAAANP